MKFEISKHASEQLKTRSISTALVKKVLEKPDQIMKQGDKAVYQGIVTEKSKNYLIRIFVNIAKVPPLVITGYKTSKVNKYYEG